MFFQAESHGLGEKFPLLSHVCADQSWRAWQDFYFFFLWRGVGCHHPELFFIVIEVGIYSLLQLKLRQKLMDFNFRAGVLFAVEFYGGIHFF